jgi:DNA-binding NtrC family response regulator
LGHGGTVFLDEIGELRLETQGKLFSAIESRTITPVGGTDQIGVDVRVIAATNRDLNKLVSIGAFRLDLFYRLNVCPVHVPPLRERKEDIRPLLDHFLRVKAQESSRSPKTPSAEVVDCMMSYPWPGNVRELENLAERLTLLSPHETLTLADLPEIMVYWNQTDRLLKGSRPLNEAVAYFERDLILKALQKTRFDEARAASLLGTTSKYLHALIEKLRIKPEEMS